MIYLDNAATTIKKPDAVYDAVLDAMKHCGISWNVGCIAFYCFGSVFR